MEEMAQVAEKAGINLNNKEKEAEEDYDDDYGDRGGGDDDDDDYDDDNEEAFPPHTRSPSEQSYEFYVQVS